MAYDPREKAELLDRATARKDGKKLLSKTVKSWINGEAKTGQLELLPEITREEASLAGRDLPGKVQWARMSSRSNPTSTFTFYAKYSLAH